MAWYVQFVVKEDFQFAGAMPGHRGIHPGFKEFKFVPELVRVRVKLLQGQNKIFKAESWSLEVGILAEYI